MSSIVDLNYFPLDIEASIYAMEVIEFEDKSSLILVASRDGYVYCIQCRDNTPHTKKIQFSYIPSRSQIISIRAIKLGIDEFVIGITHYHQSTDNPANEDSSRDDRDGRSTNPWLEYSRPRLIYYMNFYASVRDNIGEFDLEAMAQNCQTINLRYCPSFLFPTEWLKIVPNEDRLEVKREPLWMIPGSDEAVHAFVEETISNSFIEAPIDAVGFPELTEVQSMTIWMDMLYIDNGKDDTKPAFERLTCFGADDGTVIFTHGVLNRKNRRFECHRRFTWADVETPITSIRFFKIRSCQDSKLRELIPTRSGLPMGENNVNLLVVGATGPSFVVMNIIEEGFKNLYKLPGSERLDANICSTVADINHDGFSEILIGNYGRELMIFQYDNESQLYYFEDSRELKQPVSVIKTVDFTSNAVDDIVLLISDGVLVLQYRVDDVLLKLDRRLKLMTEFTKTHQQGLVNQATPLKG